MIRTLALLCAVAALTATASSQCFNGTGGTSITGSLIAFTGFDPAHDEGRSPVTALGFAFPMPGAGTFTDCVIESNGLIYLTNAVNPPFLGNYAYGSLANLAGVAGTGPRIAPYWRDLWAMPTGWDITTSSVPGVSFTVIWLNTTNYFATATQKSFSATLYATGVVEYSYDNMVCEASAFTGISVGNAIGGTQPTSNFAASPTGGTVPLMWEAFTAANFDLAIRTLRFTPNGVGGFDVSSPCSVQAASHTSYGAGCYNISNSFYELHANATAASPALTGQAYQFLPVGGNYLITSGGSFLTPVAPVNLFATASDDGEILVTPSLALPTPQGPQASVRVHANGIVSWGAAGQTFPGTNNYTPTAAGFLGGANAGVYAWHDYNEAEAGSGRIVREELTVGADTVLVITWSGVENYSSPLVANPSTMQIQCNLSTGVITLVFPSIDANATSTFGSAHLIGYSPAGASVDGGSQVFATSLPTLTGVGASPMVLSATPAPVSTAGSGTLVTYTQSNIPEAAPASGVYLGLTIISVGQDLPGTDLFFIGMPGCSLHVTSLDVTLAFVGVGNSLTTSFQIPAGVPYGTQLFAQSAAIIAPGSMPNGQNAFGATLSNGVASFISSF